MRIGLSGLVIAAAVSGAAAAARPDTRIDLPPGTLAVAIAEVSVASGVNIGTSDPALLDASLPELHLRGSVGSILSDIASRIGAKSIRKASKAWLIAPQRKRDSATVQTTPPAPQDIVVLGSKRDERLTDIPAEIVHITSVSLDPLATTDDTRALEALVPTLASTAWGEGHEKLFLRGIADSSFTGASPTLVGEYLGDQRLNYNAPDPGLRLYDVASIEVLEGAQGTLYGSGAMGGLILIEPRAPEFAKTAGSIWSGLTSVAHGAIGGDAGATINLPLGDDRLAFRAVGYFASDPGYIDDTSRGLKNVNRAKTAGGRTALRWTPAAHWTIDLSSAAQRIDNRDAPYVDVGAGRLTRSSPIAQPSANLLLSGNFAVTGRIGGVTVHSATGLVHQSLGDLFDVVRPLSNPTLFNDREHADLFSQETRLSGGGKAMNWVIGASFLSSRDEDVRDYGTVNILRQIALLHSDSREVTVFGEATRQLSDRFSLTLGSRYSATRFQGRAVDNASPFYTLAKTQVAASNESHRLLPSAALLYKINGGVALFARYERGFRPAGLTLKTDAEEFASDEIDTVEAGVRRDVSTGSRLAFSLDGAVSRWRNVQADLLDGIGFPYVANIGDGIVRSMNATATLRLLPGLQLDLAGFLARGRLHPTPAIAALGNADTLPNVVRNGGTFSIAYHSPVADRHPWRVEVRLQHVGRSLAGVGPFLAQAQGDYTTAAVSAGMSLGRVALSLDITNLFDSRATAFAIGSPFAGLRREVTPLRPRTIRLGTRYDF